MRRQCCTAAEENKQSRSRDSVEWWWGGQAGTACHVTDKQRAIQQVGPPAGADVDAPAIQRLHGKLEALPLLQAAVDALSSSRLRPCLCWCARGLPRAPIQAIPSVLLSSHCSPACSPTCPTRFLDGTRTSSNMTAVVGCAFHPSLDSGLPNDRPLVPYTRQDGRRGTVRCRAMHWCGWEACAATRPCSKPFNTNAWPSPSQRGRRRCPWGQALQCAP